MRTIFLLAALFALTLALRVTMPVFACEPRSELDPTCEMPQPKPRVIARVVPTATPAPNVPKPTVVVSLNRGTSPSDALRMDGNTWHTVAPNSYLWFMNDNGTNFYQTVVLETKLANGVNFAAFAPEQENGLTTSSPPKGRGTLAPPDSGYPKYTWKGSHAQGRWFFLVTNYNAAPVEVKLSFDQKPDDRQCRSFWEVDAFGRNVYWTDCGMYGLNK